MKLPCLCARFNRRKFLADAAGGRYALFERDEKILVQFLLLAAGLMFQPFALLNRVVLLWGAHAPRVRCSAPSRNTQAHEKIWPL